jgi:hypothetical protein
MLLLVKMKLLFTLGLSSRMDSGDGDKKQKGRYFLTLLLRLLRIPPLGYLSALILWMGKIMGGVGLKST